MERASAADKSRPSFRLSQSTRSSIGGGRVNSALRSASPPTSRIPGHPCSSNSIARASPRVVLGIPIQYRFGNTIAAALTLNLSHGGIAIRTTSPLDGGAKIKVRFRMPGSKNDIDAEGRVAWSDRRVGMGIQFEIVDPAHQAVIDHFVDAHFFSNRKA